jgi:uncharacterized phage infection (PIP) family protein YhgE
MYDTDVAIGTWVEVVFANSQDLTRQVSVLRESLMAAGQLSEQLEEKMEELEDDNEDLSTRLTQCQGELEKRERKIQKLQGKLEEQEVRLLELKMEYREVTTEKKALEKELLEERQKNETPLSPLLGEKDELVVQLNGEVSKLVLKLSECNLQRDNMAEQLSVTLHENELLEHKLLQAEAHAEELRYKLASLEETDGPSKSLQGSALRRSRSMRHTSSYSRQLRSPLKPIPSECVARRSPLSSRSSSTTSPTNMVASVSLWNELDTQCTHIQEQFDQWVNRCNCSASLEYRQFVKLSSTKNATETKPSRPQTPAGQAFKEMFDELFASLRETTAVANKLLGVDGRCNEEPSN